jgi:hypothetical protein
MPLVYHPRVPSGTYLEEWGAGERADRSLGSPEMMSHVLRPAPADLEDRIVQRVSHAPGGNQ